MVSITRIRKISDRIREELSILLLTEIKDPRLSGISITSVKVDKELAFADIYVSALEGSKRAREIIKGFDQARGFIRRYLSKKINIRSFPKLRFHWDPTYENAEQIDMLLHKIKEESGDISD